MTTEVKIIIVVVIAVAAGVLYFRNGGPGFGGLLRKKRK